MTPIESLQIGMHWFPERPGGLSRVFHALINSLPGTGVSVRGMVAGSAGVEGASGGSVRAFAPPDIILPLRLIAARCALARMISDHVPDVIAAHFALYAWPALDALRQYPMVMHFHGPWSEESHAEGRANFSHTIKRQIEAAVYTRSTLAIVLSQAFAKVLETHYRIDAKRIRTVPGCVDAARFDIRETQHDARAALGWPTDRPIVIAVRRLVRRMGLEDLIAAIDTVRHSVPDVLLIIVGGGPLIDELRACMAERKLDKYVQLAGRLPDEQLPYAYRAADLSIVPTVALEGFGLTTIESLAAGTPVLVTPIGGLPEAVGALSPDLVLAQTGAPALADGMIHALRGSLKLPTDGMCRAYARATFDVPIIAAQVAKVYREAITLFGN